MVEIRKIYHIHGDFIEDSCHAQSCTKPIFLRGLILGLQRCQRRADGIKLGACGLVDVILVGRRYKKLFINDRLAGVNIWFALARRHVCKFNTEGVDY